MLLKEKILVIKGELLKLVINKSLTDEEEGRLLEVCIRIWKDIHKKPGTRSYAFQCIDNITTIYPELRNELMGLFGPEYLRNLITSNTENNINEIEIY